MKSIVLTTFTFLALTLVTGCSASKGKRSVADASIATSPSTGSSTSSTSSSSGSTSSTSSSSSGSTSSTSSSSSSSGSTSSTSSTSSSSGSTSSSSSSGGTVVTASISGAPTGTNNTTTLDITVSGTGLQFYKYKVGNGSTDCAVLSGYSADVAIATHITSSLVSIADGSVNLCVIGKDNLGTYQDYNSATTATWTKDTSVATATLSGVPSGTSNSTILNISVAGSGVTDYQYKVGLSATTTCTVYSGYSADISVSTPITDDFSGTADGAMVVCVIGKNALGTYQSSASATSSSWTKDTTAPALGFSGAPSGANNSTTLNIAITGTGVTHYKYKVGDGTLDCSDSNNYSVSDVSVGTNITDSISAIADGTVKICAVGRDVTGNYQAYASATTASWTKDTVAPTLTLTGAPTGTNNSTTLNITLGGAGVTNYKYKVGTSSLDCTSGSGYSASEIAVGTNITESISAIADGTVKICAVGSDSAGNYQAFASATTTSWSKDTTAPSKPSALSLLSPSTSPNNVTQPTITVTGVVQGDTVGIYKNDNTCGIGNLVVSGTVAISQTTISLQVSSALSDGSYTFYAKSSDPSGNSLGCSVATLSYTLDTVLPTTPGSVTMGALFAGTSASPTISWTASTDTGGSGIANYKVQIYDSTNATVGSLTTLASGSTMTGLSLTAGKYKVKVTAYDNAGNTSSASPYAADWVVCPSNYIFVPALAGYTTSGFCAMKWEARNSSGTASATSSGTPDNTITVATATTRCQANTPSGKYDLMLNAEWMSIVRNIAAVNSNWSSSTVGSGYINFGVYNQNTTTLCNGTGVYSSWSSGCSNTVTSFDYKRTNTLSNGEIIWDLGGSVFEFMKDYVSSPTNSTGFTDGNISALTGNTSSWTLSSGQTGSFVAVFGTSTGSGCNSAGSNYCGYGLSGLNYNSGNLIRGGYYGAGGSRGVYSAILYNDSTYAAGDTGYRCVFHP